MARGKKAVGAANRRLDATRDHVDRLTEQLVDAKMRARRHERAAEKLPMVEAELARVRQLADDGASDELIREQQKRTHLVDQHEARIGEMRDLFDRVMNNLMDYCDNHELVSPDIFSDEDVRAAVRFGMTGWMQHKDTNRRKRRTLNMEGLHTQDNRRQAGKVPLHTAPPERPSGRQGL